MYERFSRTVVRKASKQKNTRIEHYEKESNLIYFLLFNKS